MINKKPFDLKEATTMIPKFDIRVVDGIPGIYIYADEKTWNFDTNWMNGFVSKIQEEYNNHTGNEKVVRNTARRLLESAVQQGKVWRK